MTKHSDGVSVRDHTKPVGAAVCARETLLLARLDSVTRIVMNKKQMQIEAVCVDKASGKGLIILRDLKGKLLMPIWVGVAAARALSMASNKTRPSRPSTYDLLLSTFTALDMRVNDVCLEANKDDEFRAWVNLEPDRLKSSAMRIAVDPSDAVVLASLSAAPLYVCSDLFEGIGIEQQNDEEDNLKFKKFLQDVNPSDFSKYCSKQQDEDRTD